MRWQAMEHVLIALRAAAEPTRLRLLALAAGGQFCVTEFAEILAQSQPRLSRHLRLLGEAGLLDRAREGANTWFTLPPVATPVQSSRLIQSCGPPRCAVRRGLNSRGVGAWQSLTRGKRARCIGTIS